MRSEQRVSEFPPVSVLLLDVGAACMLVLHKYSFILFFVHCHKPKLQLESAEVKVSVPSPPASDSRS